MAGTLALNDAGLTGGDDRICVMEDEIQQATLQSFLRGELTTQTDVG
jgi:hypothetical protein